MERADIALLEYDELEYKVIDGKTRLENNILHLNRNTFDALRAVLAQDNKGVINLVVKDEIRNKRKIKTKNWVGFFEVGGSSITVLPKIIPISSENIEDMQKELGKKSEDIIKVLIRMLEIGWNIPIRDVNVSNMLHDRDSLLEIF